MSFIDAMRFRVGVFTDFVTDAFGINEGWKLNTPFESSTKSVLP